MSCRASTTSAVFVLLFLLTPVPPAMADTAVSDVVLIRAEDVISDDLYASGNKVNVQGRVDGDLVAAAFEEVRIDGVVTGDVTAAAGRVIVNGEVEGSLRALSGSVEIAGTVREDVVAAAVRLSAGGEIGGDVIVTAWSGEQEGQIDGDFLGNFGRTTIDGIVHGDVEVSTRSLQIDPKAQIGGDLIYRSRKTLATQDVNVGGTVVHQTPLPPNVRVRGLGYLLLIVGIVSIALLGLGACWAMPGPVANAAGLVRKKIGRSFLVGLAAAIAPWVLVGLLLLLIGGSAPQNAVPLFLGILPVVLALIGMALLVAVVAPIPVAVAIGATLARRRQIHAQFMIGLVVVLALMIIPLFGWWVALPVIVLGLGSWLQRPNRNQ